VQGLSYEVEADPRRLGIDPRKVEALVERARREVESGLLPSCQLALARRGRLAAFVTLGAAEPGSRYVVFSCTKALIAGGIWLLIGDGKLDVRRRVAEVVPEFGANGKDAIRIEQLLTHTGGFPRAPLGPPDWADRAKRLERFARWYPNWEPGSRMEYHPTSAHWVLAEIIERLAGEDYRRFLRRRSLEPLGLRGPRLGGPLGEQQHINRVFRVGEPPSADELEAVTGVRGLRLAGLSDDALLVFNEPAALAVGVPGGGAVATAADLALYYQGLLHNPGGLWETETLRDGTGRVRVTLPDPMTGVPANRSLGLIIAGDDGKGVFRGLGKLTSPATFGHNGAGGQIAWADPASGLSFCYLTNGLDANFLHSGARGAGLSNRAAACIA